MSKQPKPKTEGAQAALPANLRVAVSYAAAPVGHTYAAAPAAYATQVAAYAAPAAVKTVGAVKTRGGY